MPATFNKFQPDRTLYLRGFNTFAAAATIHSASPTGFTVSGTFRDPADFAVAVLYDADNVFEHPLIRYLPDFNLSGLTLSFDLNYSAGLQPIDSPKYNWIDWATLDCIRADGTKAQVRLFDHATLVDSAFPAAAATCTLVTGSTGIQAYDRATLWYQNLAFDYIIPAGVASVTFSFFAGGPGTVHSITVNGTAYPYTEPAAGTGGAGIGSNDVATALAGAVNGAQPFVTAVPSGNSVLLTVISAPAAQDGIPFSVSATDGNAAATMRYTSPTFVAGKIAAQINATDWIAANAPFALLATTAGPAITVTAARYGSATVSGTNVTIPSSSTPVTVFSGITAGSPILLGGVEYSVASVQSPTQLTLTTAATSGSSVAWVAPRGGYDGNLIELYSLSKTSSLAFDALQYALTGGNSNVTWNCSLDFTSLGIDSLRQCWLTFAPALVSGEYPATEWQAVFSNWELSGPAATQQLTVAGPGSNRIEQRDSACSFTGGWSLETGFYSGYFARLSRSDFSALAAGDSIQLGGAAYTIAVIASPTHLTLAAAAPSGTNVVWSAASDSAGLATVSGASVTAAAPDPNASVTVSYICQFEHDLWIGTSLCSNGAAVSVSVDTGTANTVSTQLTVDSPIVTRRQAQIGIAAGKHTVTITPTSPGVFYFNFLEAAVASAPPAALTPRTGVSPALDFDTNQSYMLPPARIMWMMDQLGYAGPMNEYLGVFWWNQRVQTGALFSTARVTFSGAFADGDSVTLTLNGVEIGKSVFPADTNETIAAHFAALINGAFVGAWASSSGSVLTVMGRSAAAAYNVTIAVSATSAAGAASISQSPQPGQEGSWVIDDAITPPINRATRDWHADLYAECATRSREIVTSCSMELVNPPSGYAAMFPGLTPVTTATGFGSLNSTQCAIGASKMLAFQKAVYRSIAGLQASAGLTPCLQYGEFLWWYFPAAQNLAVGYAGYTSPISIGTATPHGLATGVQVAISGVQGNTAANGTWTITVTDNTHFMLNGSSGNGTYTGGGVILGGGMGYYDAETTAAAETALGRALHSFNFQSDDPTVNSGADALFLSDRLRDHVAALVADIRSVYPSAICELLWPYDVNYPSLLSAGSAAPLGGPLNYAVNLPAEWRTQASGSFSRIKVEALAFGTSFRNLNLAAEAIGLFPSFGWSPADLRYLVPVFGTACPWRRELALAIAAGFTTNNFWAFDHICLYNLQVPEGTLERRSFVKTA